MKPDALTRLSRGMSHALRHAPAEYGLTLDPEGWVEVDALLAALRDRRRPWAALEMADIEAVVAAGPKRRFELVEGRIRARYGHSVARVEYPVAVPPDTLYHGTPPGAAAAIEAEGLKPMGRRYVHLSVDRATAVMVGSRRHPRPVIFRVDAAAAHAAGVRFYFGQDTTWLADAVGPGYLARLPPETVESP